MADEEIKWSSEQMIENASNWSLAGDVALLNRLKSFSEKFLTNTENIHSKVNDLLNNLDEVNLKLDLTRNEFHSLRNTQFIENRVYEDDETLDNDEKEVIETEPTDEDKEQTIKSSITKGMQVMDKFYNKVEFSASDSEGEGNDNNYVLHSKDLYADRPLPYLVGSEDWYKKWHVGLLVSSDSESDSEKKEEVYSSDTDSEEYLPKNRQTAGSETSSEFEFTNRNTGPVANSTFNDTHPVSDIHSSDENSEKSGSLPIQSPVMKDNFAEQLAAKLGDVINNKSEDGPGLIKHVQQSAPQPNYGNLFSDEPPPLDESSDAEALPKATRPDLFSDKTTDFNVSKMFAKPKEGSSLFESAKTPKKGLFDDSSSDDDVLTVTEKRKILSAAAPNRYMQPPKATLPFLDEEPPKLHSKLSETETASEKKKPIGGLSIFGENSKILSEVGEKRGALKKISLFDDESSDEDMFIPAKPVESIENKSLSLFEEPDEIVAIEQPTGEKSKTAPKKISLFDDLDDENEDNSLFFNEKMPEPKKIVLLDEPEKIPVKKVSLFDEDEDDNLFKDEEDIFGDYSTRALKTSATSIRPNNKSLFEDLDSDSNESSYTTTVGAKSFLVSDESPSQGEPSEAKFAKNILVSEETPSPSGSSGNPQKNVLFSDEPPPLDDSVEEEASSSTTHEIITNRSEYSESSNRQKITQTLSKDNEKQSEVEENVSEVSKELDEKSSKLETSKIEFAPTLPDQTQHINSIDSIRQDSFKPPIVQKESVIGLFDPTPPPVDWDTTSMHSNDSDTSSITEGILERLSYNNNNANQQQQPTVSGIFDEAPPSLNDQDMNYSSGICVNATRMESDASTSFNPYASSSRRLSNDIFSEQQSVDSFFVTKTGSSLETPNLENIPENGDESSSRFDYLTPSGNIDDFDESNNGMETTKSNATESKVFDAKDDREKNVPPIKSPPGKLKHNLQINVGALLPGGAPPRIGLLKKSVSVDESDNRGSAVLTQPSGLLARPKSACFEEPDQLSSEFEGLTTKTEVLQTVTKDRARITVKRRPSSRRARQEALRQSQSDFSLYPDTASPPAAKKEDKADVGTKDLSSVKTDNSSPATKGISLVFSSKTKSKDLFTNPEDEDDENDIFKAVTSRTNMSNPLDKTTTTVEASIKTTTLKVDTKNVLDNKKESSGKLESGKLAMPRNAVSSVKPNASIFGEDSDDDLFSNIVSKKKMPKPDLFLDKSDSDADEALFGEAAKPPSTLATKKSSLFDDLEDSSDDDLFGSKVGSTSSTTTTSLKGSSTISRNEIKTATIKKLENKQVTDFDPLSGFK